MPLGGKKLEDPIICNKDFPTVIYNSMKTFGNDIFLIDGLKETTRTFKEVLDAAVSVAVSLEKRGIVGDGSYVAFLTDLSVDAFVFSIGVLLAGGCICPLNPNLLPNEIAQMFDISTAEVVYCDEAYLNQLEMAKPISNRTNYKVITNRDHQKYLNISDMLSEDISTFSVKPYNPDEHIAYVIFTSGTTGVSKGVMLSSTCCVMYAFRVFNSKGPNFVTSPYFWVSGPSAFFNSMITGNALVFPGAKVLPGTNIPDYDYLLKCIEKYRPSKWMTGPSVAMELATFAKNCNYDLSSITHVSVGGSTVPPDQKKYICDNLFGRKVVQERYGSTESGFFTTQWTFPPPDYDDKKSSSIGPVCDGIEVKIVDINTGEELGPNQLGELHVRGTGVMRGYINKDMPKVYTKDDWYAMGDLAYYDEDEWLYIQSRLKDIIKYRGYQMAPIDLENVIRQHPEVKDTCVVGRPHPIDSERITAFVVRYPNSKLTEDELHSFVNERISDEKRIRGGIFFRESLPLSSIGKLLRRQLLDELKE